MSAGDVGELVERLPVWSWPRSTWVLRAMVLLLPVAALLVALPRLPHPLVAAAVVLGAARWAWLPEDLSGLLVLLVVAAWWWTHGALDWRLPVVALLLLAAHVAAVLASYGPGALPLDRALLGLWLGRAGLAAVPVPIAWWAVRRLEADQAPGWLWTVSMLVVVGLLLAASLGALAGDDE